MPPVPPLPVALPPEPELLALGLPLLVLVFPPLPPLLALLGGVAVVSSAQPHASAASTSESDVRKALVSEAKRMQDPRASLAGAPRQARATYHGLRTVP
jgi:hypothetical protein